MLKKFTILIMCLSCYTPFAYAEVLSLDDALRATYTACVGIDEQLSELKKMAGINTAVTGVGTGLGIGAVVVGGLKDKQDKLREKLDKELQNINTMSNAEFLQFLADVEQFKEYQKKVAEQDAANAKSKKLGNWRTGLMAGNTATNIAGAIIADKNKVKGDLQIQIDDCKLAINNLEKSIMQAHMDGEDTNEATEIVNACKEYEYIDISSINKRATGAMVSSIIGAVSGGSGTVISAASNSNSIRKDEDSKQGKKTDADWQHEKNLNITANVLAGTSAVSSAVATVFNATQISAIKKTALIAEKCTKALK